MLRKLKTVAAMLVLLTIAAVPIWWMVFQGGKSCGSIRQGAPLLTIHLSPL